MARIDARLDETTAAPEAPLLILNADDFGMTPGISRAVLAAHATGTVTSTSVLANGAALKPYAAALTDCGIGTGAHLAAVGADPPLLAAREIPSLVDHRGRFPPSWTGFVRQAASGRVDPSDLRREFSAQIEHLHAEGLSLSHLDSHQNLHLWPSVARVLFELAERYEVAAIRIPRIATVAPVSLGVRLLSSRLARGAERAGVVFPGSSMGLDEVPGDHRHGITTAVDRLASSGAASAELVLHLACDPDPARSLHPSRFDWAGQFRAASDPAVARRISRSGIRLGTFHDLAELSRWSRCRAAATGPVATSGSH